jgi:hypothetical protein
MRYSGLGVLITICLFLCASCAGVAKMSAFSQTAETFDFDKLAQQNYESKDAMWNQQTEYEYFIEIERITEDELFKQIIDALVKSGYDISYENKQNRAIIGERGLRLNEWNSIIGVYYKQREDFFQVFIKNAITQDITGGWRENRAKKVAMVLCANLSKCKTKPE